ncbi:5'/3'-nucleotidase sure [Ceraceosorus guamensis]|uniref:5'/3'-nucleotidase sure n=1 Tax=Ceraceosorus guamensis TaxID=1522189 RepID=A0A316W0R7_9BASI|nr:5'/3'-nucleotidase sure [Ceraceosorus guamensis]PWN42323.1 5'/3'-nucleotidase sure [Ceraceosorus guamensis]
MKLSTSLLFLSVLVGSALTAAAPAPAEYGVGAAGFANVVKARRPLNILLTNDDSWASANIRATYYALKSAGHKVLLVGPAMNQSGKGGTVVFPTSKTLTAPGRNNSIPVGAPFSGKNATDSNIRYFDGTPAATALWALDFDVPDVFGSQDKLDLVASGPNEGNNLGPFVSDLSGTVGASRVSVGRGISSIAFSASSAPRDYTLLDLNNPKDESILIGTQTANLISRYGDARGNNRLFPLGLGGNVNYSPLNATCPVPTWAATRISGGNALTDKVILNGAGLPTYQNLVAPGVNAIINGLPTLQGETAAVAAGCTAAFSIYSQDYDAPITATAPLAPAVGLTIAQLNRK